MFETTENKGSASFLSNTAFIGTGSKSGLRLIRDLENLGAQFQSSGDRESISVSLQVLSDKVEQAFSLVADAIISPPKSLHVISEAKEQVQIIYDDLKASPMKQLDELIHEVAFGESSLGSSFYADSLDEIEPTTVLEYRNDHYKSGNLTISGNGIHHEALCALTECYFHKLVPGSSVAPSVEYVGGELKVKADLKGISYGGVAFYVPEGSRDDGSVLFNTLTTKLQKLDVPKGSLTPFYSQYQSGGLIGFFAGGSPSSLAEYLKIGVTELKSLSSESVDFSSSIKQVSLGVASSNDSDSIPKEVKSSSTVSSVIQSLKTILSSKPSYVVYGRTAGTLSYSTVVSWIK